MKIGIIFILCCFMNYLVAQDFSVGLGFELNQTRFRLDKATYQAITFNPHNADFGISSHALLTATFAGKYLISLKPGLSIMRTRSDIYHNYRMKFITLGVEIGYCLRKFRIIGGVEYSSLDRLISTKGGNTVNFTKDANHRQFVNPTLSIAYFIDENWSTHIRCLYFLKNIFNSGTLDANGTFVSPVLVTPWSIGLGVNYSFHFNMANKPT